MSSCTKELISVYWTTHIQLSTTTVLRLARVYVCIWMLWTTNIWTCLREPLEWSHIRWFPCVLSKATSPRHAVITFEWLQIWSLTYQLPDMQESRADNFPPRLWYRLTALITSVFQITSSSLSLLLRFLYCLHYNVILSIPTHFVLLLTRV